jgi:tetratricopeptide (TPR) repeat protein
MSSVIDNEKDRSNQIEFVLFMAKWDEELGPEILDFCPKSSILDLESLANSIFATYQHFWSKPDEQLKSTKVILPVVNLNRKAQVLLELIFNREVRGGFQPFIVVLLVPDYITDLKLEKFDTALLMVAKKFVNEQEIILEKGYAEIEEIFIKDQEIEVSELEVDEYYSYTAAVEDFRAGVQLFQTKHFDDAHTLLRKCLMKFEQDEHKNLIMEVEYLIASLFAQKKQFSVAEDHYLRLEVLADELGHQKYNEISVFMSGFCAYKNERFVEAIQQFSKIELFKKEFINEFQYNTMYGRALANLQDYEESIKKLTFAIRVIKSQQQTVAIKKQQGQILHELGIVYYKFALEKTRQLGIDKQENFKEFLDEAVGYFEQSAEIWIEVKDDMQIFKTYSLIGDIFEFLGDDVKFFEYYNKALKYGEKSENLANQIKVLKRIIQKQDILGLYEENIKSIRTILEKFEGYKLFDLHTASILHKHLGISLVKTDQLEDGLAELITAFEILEKFKKTVDDELQILNRIIILCRKLKDNEKFAFYSEKREDVEAKLKTKEAEETKEVKALGVLKDVWIFSKTIGIELYTYSVETKVESDLLGGFMTAIQALSQEIAYKSLDSMIFGDDRFTIYQEEDRDFYILARSSGKVSEEISEKVISIIYSRFWKEYYNEINNFQGNVTPFRGFTKILESFDWTLVSIEREVEQIIPSAKIMESRRELKQLAKIVPDAQKALPVDEAAIGVDLKQRALEKKEALMKQPMFLDELKEEQITEDDVAVFKEKRICLVHKGEIRGFMFSCTCGALYCTKCVDALIEIENFCWACDATLDPNKPSQKEDLKKAEEEIKEEDILVDEGSPETPKAEVSHKDPKVEDSHKAPKAEVSHKAPKAEVSHKDPKAEVSHKGPKAEVSHKGPKAEVSHKGPKVEVSHKGPKAEVSHKGPKAETMEKAPKRETLKIAAKKKKKDD